MSVLAIAMPLTSSSMAYGLSRLRPESAHDGLMPQRPTKMLGIFSLAKQLFSRRTFMISCSSYMNAERQSYFFLFKYRILRKNWNGTPALKQQTRFQSQFGTQVMVRKTRIFSRETKIVHLFPRSKSKQDTNIYFW